MSAPYSPDVYGQPYPGYAPQPAPIRPRVLWIVLSWVLFVVLLVVGVAGFGMGLFSSINDAAPTSTFSSGESVKLQLDPVNKPVIWASAEDPTNVTCQAVDTRQREVELSNVTSRQTLTLGSQRWEALFDVAVTAPGTYQIDCEGESVTFGVGESLAASGGKIVGSVAMLALPAIGFLLALIVTIVVLVRRSGARKRQMMY